MQFRISIDTDNDAFGITHEEACGELSSILFFVGQALDRGDIDEHGKMKLRDSNGNTVGYAKFTDE